MYALDSMCRAAQRPWFDTLVLAWQAVLCIIAWAARRVLVQVVRTTIEPAYRPRDNSYDAYEYTAHSHTYNSYEIPSAKARARPGRTERLLMQHTHCVICHTRLADTHGVSMQQAVLPRA